MRLLDRYVPAHHVREVHACDVAAESATILDHVAAYRPEADRFFTRMIGLRELPMRLLGRTDAARPAFGLDDFTLLDRDESAIVYGLIGRFWRTDYGLEPIADAAAFLAFDAPEVAKLALAFSARPGPNGQTRLVTETRVCCCSRAARLKFTPYWMAIRPVSGLIRRRMLAALKWDCERASAAGTVNAAGSP